MLGRGKGNSCFSAFHFPAVRKAEEADVVAVNNAWKLTDVSVNSNIDFFFFFLSEEGWHFICSFSFSFVFWNHKAEEVCSLYSCKPRYLCNFRSIKDVFIGEGSPHDAKWHVDVTNEFQLKLPSMVNSGIRDESFIWISPYPVLLLQLAFVFSMSQITSC